MSAEAASNRNAESNRNPEPIRSIQLRYHSLDGFTDIWKKDILTELAGAKTLEDLVEAADDLNYALSQYKADRKNVFIEDEGVPSRNETYNSIIKPDNSIEEGANENINVDHESRVTAVAEQEKIYDWIREDMRASEERQRAMEERIDSHIIESEKRIEKRLDKIDSNQEKLNEKIESTRVALEDKIDNNKKHWQTIVVAAIAALAAIASVLVPFLRGTPS